MPEPRQPSTPQGSPQGTPNSTPGSTPHGPPLAPVSATLPRSAERELADALRTLQRGSSPLVRSAELLAGAVNTASAAAARSLLHNRPELQARIRHASQTALARAFDIAVLGLRHRVPRGRGLARAAVTLSGAMGGLYGLPGLLPDLGLSTLAIMRDIARIARQHGEDLTTESARRACLEVFLLAPAAVAEGIDMPEPELSYFSARMLLRGGPVATVMEQAAARYGLILSRKLTLQAVPVLGAAIGITLNNAFLNRYRELARAHFAIRRLERLHGEQPVRDTASRLADRLAIPGSARR